MGYTAPDTLSEALTHLVDSDVKVIAGCTDYFPQHGTRQACPRVLDVTGIPELRGVVRNDTGWRIGATTTWTDIIRADLPTAFDGLKAAACEVGSVQIQNAGTIAGNLCNASPAADGVPPLLTLDATIELRSFGGRRDVALSDFITGVRRIDLAPGELVTAIHIPDLPARTTSSFLKLGSRKYLVISIAMVSALVSLDGAGRIDVARISVGACSAVATRLHGLEAALIGLSPDQLGGLPDIWPELFSVHLGPLSPIADVRGSAEYRLEAASELCRRAVLAALTATGEHMNG